MARNEQIEQNGGARGFVSDWQLIDSPIPEQDSASAEAEVRKHFDSTGTIHQFAMIPDAIRPRAEALAAQVRAAHARELAAKAAPATAAAKQHANITGDRWPTPEPVIKPAAGGRRPFITIPRLDGPAVTPDADDVARMLRIAALAAATGCALSAVLWIVGL